MIQYKRFGAAFVFALGIALISGAVSAVPASGIVGGPVDGTAPGVVGCSRLMEAAGGYLSARAGVRRQCGSACASLRAWSG